MKTSDAIDKLAPALVAAQAAIKPAIKDATNPHFRSKYADLSAVHGAIRGALDANHLALMQLPAHSEDGRAHLTTRLVHASGQWIEETASIPVAKQDAHGYGSAITYLRRYSAVAAFFVPTEDDDGNDAAKGNGEAKAAPPRGSAAEVAHDAFNDLPAAVQHELRTLANSIIDTHNAGGDAAALIPNEMDNEDKLALWSQLPSNVRTALQKRARQPKPELASQA